MEEVWHLSGHLLFLNMPYPHPILCSPSRKDRDDPSTIPYIQDVSTRILLDINVQVHMKPLRTLRSGWHTVHVGWFAR